ncbi:UDP-3-O-(3-hydroxymyristoyl)glucosamine N-acyltransferase [Halorhodospira halophila]|uniref:UDP-3-O-(3-hydroxymyristoyl)glucosamine N-acyltransferase n=1 Tax=Halorhodospira halophila TaxID=1053 RepID=UPI001912C9BC|nr:UDP-3-O-(3-hydroxymyristoyl)glucosamine N-acyltransferase [Halorhodospira halophila]MBK5936179.1 UDP-3-O-(3-hydroxymyristoyl)glucosamine N-acyltransferase [Halorhodospira halophila]
MTSAMTIQELAARVGARVAGDGDRPVRRAATLLGAGDDAVAFCTSQRHLSDLRRCAAAAVLVRAEYESECPVTALVVGDPYLAFIDAVELLHPEAPALTGVQSGAVVSSEAVLEDGVSVGPNAVVEAGAMLGAGSTVAPGAFVGAAARLGAGGWLGPNAVLGGGCRTGERVRIHAGAVIGADGFGYAPLPDGKGWRKVPQIGAVEIGDDVEIGANATVDRGALEDTVIEAGVKLDDHVHIAHNCRVGARTVIAGGAVVAGSTIIGRDCMIGGLVAITDNIRIADGVSLMGMTGVTGSIREPGAYASPLPAQPVRQWRRNTVRFTQLDSLFRRVQALEGHRGGAAEEGGGSDD